MAKAKTTRSISNSKVASSTRQKKLTKKQVKQKTKKELSSRTSLPGSIKLTKNAVSMIKEHWRTLSGIVLVYLFLNIVFASGISGLGTAVDNIKYNLDQTTSSSVGPLGTALDGFGTLVASSGTGTSSTGSVLQTVLIVIESLVIIWALRQLSGGKKVGVKEAYYSSMGPLIPFLLIVGVVFVQFLPLLLGSSLASAVLSSVFVSGGSGPVIIFAVIFAIFASWTFYMISASLFAIYIVTLPGMHPRRALKSAKDLVKFRRWSIMRKLFFLPVFIFIVMAVIVVPLIMYATYLVAPVFFGLSMLALLFAHTYLYGVYRNLLE